MQNTNLFVSPEPLRHCRLTVMPLNVLAWSNNMVKRTPAQSWLALVADRLHEETWRSKGQHNPNRAEILTVPNVFPKVFVVPSC